MACGTSEGSLQALTPYGPVGSAALVCESHPAGLAMNAASFLAASSLAPVVVLGMYTPAGLHTVNPLDDASLPGMGNTPTSCLALGTRSYSCGRVPLSIG